MPYLVAADLPTEPAGIRFRKLLERPQILRMPGTHNGIAGLQAARAGFEALYLSSVGRCLDAQGERCGVLGGEGDGGGPESPQLGVQRPRIHRLGRQLMIRSDLGLVEVGEPEAQRQQLGKTLGCQPFRRQADRVQGRPESIAGIGVVGARLERGWARRGAAEHQVETRCQQVRDEMTIQP